MYHIKKDKIWELIQLDADIQKELKSHLKDQERAIQKTFLLNQTSIKNLESLKEKLEQVKKKESEIQDQENKLNNEISFAHIWIMYHRHKVRTLKRQMPDDPEKQEFFLKSIIHHEEEIQTLGLKQLACSINIADYKNQGKRLKEERKERQEEINLASKEVTRTQKNYQEWINEKEEMTARFYQNKMEEMTTDYKSCQDLVVRHLESDKKLTKEEAKSKTNPIIFDEEEMLRNPDLIHKVRRLTKEEKEGEYKKIA